MKTFQNRTLILGLLLALPLHAQTTTTDDFTNPSNWNVIRVSSAATTLAVANGRMNYTTSSSAASGAIATWSGPKLPVNQNWSLAADAHIDAFTMPTANQFADLFLGVARTSDIFNTAFLLEFDRGNWGDGVGYDIGDDITVAGSDVSGILNEYNLTSPDVSLRMDYNAAARRLTYYFDSNGATGGYSWVSKGILPLDATFDSIGLSSSETFTVMVVGSSELQTVASGTAYLSNLRVTVGGNVVVPVPEIVVQQPAGTDTFDGGSKSFGAVNFGSSNSLTFTIKNTGGVDLTGLAITKDGANAADFSVSSLGATTVAGGGSTTFTVTFTPGAPDYRVAAIHIASNDADENLFDITLTGDKTLTYTTLNSAITITGYSGTGGAMGIPSTINGLPVTAIDSLAFANKYSLTSVNIPASVTSIGSGAFYYCTGLTSVSIPASVTSIGSGAFGNCSNLTSVSIPASVTSIGSTAFWDCSELTAISVDSANLNYSSLDGVLLNKALTTLIQCPGGKTGAYAIPTSVTSIESSAFSWCTGLTSVSIPASVTSIGGDAFRFCTHLTAIAVDAANPNYSSPDGVLLNKALTTLIQCPGGKTGAYAIPTSVTSIGSYIFYSCTNLTSVSIPASVTSIGSSAFTNCTGLTSVSIPASVTSIGGGAFRFCTGLTSALFTGKAPTVERFSYIFHDTDPYFKVYFITGASGFTTPTWQGYQSLGAADGSILTQPASTLVAIGSAATLTVTAIGTGPLTYQWYQGTSGITTTPVGTNTATFTTPALIAATSYWVKVTSPATPAGVNSNTITVTVSPSATVTTGPATWSSSTSVILTGTVNPNGLATSAQFEYGLTTSYGSTVSVTLSPDNGTDVQNVSAGISGLQPGQTYHYRLAATNSGSTATGSDMTFTTQMPEIAIEQPVGTLLTDGAASVSFGSVALGSNTSKTFAIKNTGTADLTGLSITRDGANAAEFTVTANPALSVTGPDGSTSFTVRFAPGGTGTRSASIHIASNDGDENPFDIVLTGTGIGSPEIAVLQPAGTELKDGVSSKSFGSVVVKSTVTKTFTIKNAGTANLTDLAITKTGANAKNFTVTPPLKTTLAPGASTTFKVIFKPSAKGIRKAVIHIKSNDSNENPFDIALTGKGITKAAAPSALATAAGFPTQDGDDTRQTTSTVRLVDGRKYLTLTVVKSEEDFLLRSIVEVSPNLIDWYRGRKHTTVIIDDASFLKVRDNTPLTPETKRYIRLKTTGE